MGAVKRSALAAAARAVQKAGAGSRCELVSWWYGYGWHYIVGGLGFDVLALRGHIALARVVLFAWQASGARLAFQDTVARKAWKVEVWCAKLGCDGS